MGNTYSTAGTSAERYLPYSESIPLLSVGFHLVVALPTFFVSLPSTKRSLRVASAGIWHNILLVMVVWMLSSEGGGVGRILAWPFFRSVDGGVAVLSVDSVSGSFRSEGPSIDLVDSIRNRLSRLTSLLPL